MCYYTKKRAVIVIDHMVEMYKEITKDTIEILDYLENILITATEKFELTTEPERETYYEEIVNRIKYWINELKEGE